MHNSPVPSKFCSTTLSVAQNTGSRWALPITALREPVFDSFSGALLLSPPQQ